MPLKHCSRVVLLFALLAMAVNLSAQAPEVTVGEINLSGLRWGPQTATFSVTNNADYEKTISVLTGIMFDGTYMDPHRSHRANYYIAPGETKEISQQFAIPGNYGVAELKIGVYDVVDTLDPLLDYQKVAEQPWRLEYHIPDALLGYFQEEITLPPLVSNNKDFDTEFSRLFVMLLNDGYSYGQIADLIGCDTSFVEYSGRVMQEKGYMKIANGKPVLTFPVITEPEAIEARELAEKVADELAGLVEANIPAHRENLKTLAMQKIIPPNEDDFMNGGAALYYTYPTVTALLFWYELGRDFIDPSKQLTIYENTDFCRAHIPLHMYAVQGGPYYNGTALYAAELHAERPQIWFLDSIPDVWCIENFEDAPTLYPGIHWHWVDDIAPEPFVLDTTIIERGLRGIGKGTEALVTKAKAEFKTIEDKYGHKEYLPGARYWFWNIVASRATIKLIDKGVIVRRSDGFFSYEKL